MWALNIACIPFWVPKEKFVLILNMNVLISLNFNGKEKDKNLPKCL